MKPAWIMTVLPAVVCGNTAAQEQLTIYGVIDVGMVHASNQGGRTTTDIVSGNLSGSRLGFKGNENLGDGMQALFVTEFGFDAAKLTNSALNIRQGFIGLADTRYGTLTAGRQYSVYCQFLCALGYAGLSGPTGAHPGDADALDTTVRVNNSLNYTLPAWSGAQFGATYGFGEMPDGMANGSTFSSAFKYDHGNWKFGLGYLRMRNGNTPGAWSADAAARFAVSPVNAGYASAATASYAAAAMRYTKGKWILGASFANAAHRPNGNSIFTDTAIFNNLGLFSSWQYSSSLLLGAGYAYTQENRANGIADPARYHQLSLMQIYSLSGRTTVYFLQGWQLARGTTLDKNGNRTGAVAVIGDSQNSTPSSSRNQAVFMLGLRQTF